MIDIAQSRLRAQRLVGQQPASPAEVVRLLGAVQAQDFAGAKWALGQRTAGVTEIEIDRLFDQGVILRTHVLRPTWHFVLPEDIRWQLELTGPRVRRAMGGILRRLEMGEGEIDRATAVMSAALAGATYLTRTQLVEVLRGAGINPDGQRLTHFLMAAEVDGAIISGPRRGKQFTYALLAERAPEAKWLDREEAVAELTRRYFRSHGPAQLQDFVWWSGLTVTDARAGLASAGAELRRVEIEGNEYWLDPDLVPGEPAPPAAHLLPNWDELTVAYRDRAALLDQRELDPTWFPYGILSSVVTVNGRVRGAWRKVVTREETRVEVRFLERPEALEAAAVEEARTRLEKYLQKTVLLTWV